ncbi:hypothetical protein BDA99DRAFT_523752 [Phascolomyces articulosus]|uniref:DUF8032 domain-containing protein n=1 Tax=Phascolomyces articulosus TaxID=60185 RepID=A0AAD5K3N8_9FUNG|nr:hypothetical protein BDA99DRAFT_523752 [Phascolomyces articulosus]
MSSRLTLKDLFANMPAKAESLLSQLTPEQILLIEDTISRIKRRKTDHDNNNNNNNTSNATVTIAKKIDEPQQQHIKKITTNATTSTTTKKVMTNEQENQSTATATAIANALASAMTTAALQQPNTSNTSTQTPTPTPNVSVTKTEVAIAPTTRQEPIAEVRDGVEWVSFVYSHNRTLKRYNIRTDIHTVDLQAIDQQFKEDNCVYPRANLPKETYRGNRWAYETECNVLGWKLAWLNSSEIAGKRGLIQRAVDSYRNRYPSMRSRRVARQEKLLKGTLRKRKNREDEQPSSESNGTVKQPSSSTSSGQQQQLQQQQAGAPLSTLAAAIVKPANHPKTLVIEDGGVRLRIKINVEGMDLEEIPYEFRKTNCVFPRAMIVNQPAQATARWLEESICNELGWKLAWLNQRHLAGRKNLLQRALDTYRTRYMPALQPRKNSRRAPSVPAPPLMQATLKVPTTTTTTTTPLTASALSAQNAWYEQQEQQQQQNQQPQQQQKSTAAVTGYCKVSSAESCTSGTTASLDFGDCFSLADEPTPDETISIDDTFMNNEPQQQQQQQLQQQQLQEEDTPMITPPYSPKFMTLTNTTKDCCDASSINTRLTPCSCGDESSTTVSNSTACTPSPPAFSTFFGTLPDVDHFDSFMLPPAGDMSLFADKPDPMPKSTTTITTHFPTPDFKTYDVTTLLSSPSLPSSAVQQQDLIVKMEEDDLLLPPSEFDMSNDSGVHSPLFDLF